MKGSERMAVTENDVLEEIRDQLEAIKVPGAREATPENTWADLDVDSLDLVELVQSLEDEYGIRIDDEQLKPVKTVGDAGRHRDRHDDGCRRQASGRRSRRPRRAARRGRPRRLLLVF